MSNELNYLSRTVTAGKMVRRGAGSRAATLGATATFANTLLSNRHGGGSLTLPIFADYSEADHEKSQGRVEDPNHEAVSVRAAGRPLLKQG